MCFQREEYCCGMGSRRRTGTWQRTPPHPTTAFNTAQGMAQAFRAGEYFRRMMGSDNYSPTDGCSFACSLTPAPDRRSTSSDGVS